MEQGAEAGLRGEAEGRGTLVVRGMEWAPQKQSGEENQDGYGAKGSHGHLSFRTTRLVVLPRPFVHPPFARMPGRRVVLRLCYPGSVGGLATGVKGRSLPADHVFKPAWMGLPYAPVRSGL